MNKLDRAYYDVLDLRRDATDNEVKKAFKKAVLKAHPDKGGSSEMFNMVNEAYTCLSDASKRSDYDRDLIRYKLKDGQGLATHKEYMKETQNNAEKK